jgi:bacteriocin biosynthesis cyclodehydratase domain-containing protein
MRTVNQQDSGLQSAPPRDARVVLRPRPGLLCGDGEIYLRLDGEVHTLRGRHARDVIARLLHLIDGRATEDEIVARARGQGVSPEWAVRAIRWLVEEGLCVRDRAVDPAHPELSRFEPQVRYFALHTSLPTDVQDRLRASRVNVVGLGLLGSLLVQQLAQSGIGHLRGIGPSSLGPAEAHLLGAATGDDRHEALAGWIARANLATRYRGVPATGAAMEWDTVGQDCDLAALVAPPMSVGALTAFNRAALHARVPFLAIGYEANVATVGPLVIPEETACLTCREIRRPRPETEEAFRHLQAARAETLDLGWHDETFLFAHLFAVTALAVAEMVVALSRCREPLILGREVLLNSHTWRLQTVPVLKVPRCWDCGRTRRLPPPRPFALGEAPHDRHPSGD